MPRGMPHFSGFLVISVFIFKHFPFKREIGGRRKHIFVQLSLPFLAALFSLLLPSSESIISFHSSFIFFKIIFFKNLLGETKAKKIY